MFYLVFPLLYVYDIQYIYISINISIFIFLNISSYMCIQYIHIFNLLIEVLHNSSYLGFFLEEPLNIATIVIKDIDNSGSPHA